MDTDSTTRDVFSVRGTDIVVQGHAVRTARIHGDKHKFLENPEPVIDALRSMSRRVDIFTFMQKPPETTPKYAYQMVWDNLAVLRVTTFDHWWNKQIRSYPRNRAKQAENKGVVLREVTFGDALVDGIWKIYNECPVRQGRRFPHYGKSLSRVYSDTATHLRHSIFVGAFIGDELIGFVKIVHDDTGTVANLMNILSLNRHRDKAPTNALLARAVAACAERRIQYLAYQNYSYGQKTDDGLQRFKEVNGFERMDLPRYFIPLTPIGRMVLLLGLNKRLVDRLPAPLHSALRRARRTWLARMESVPASVAPGPASANDD